MLTAFINDFWIKKKEKTLRNFKINQIADLIVFRNNR